MIAATMKLKLKRSIPQGYRQKKLDIAKLQYPKINREFVLELRNCFSILEEPSAMKVEPIINNKWNAIKTAYSETAQNVLGFKQNVAEEWISATTWQRIVESRQLKAKVLNTKSQRLHEKAKASYKNKDREVKRCARREKRAFIKTWQARPRKLQPMEIWAQFLRSPSDSTANVQPILPMLGTKMATSAHPNVSKQPDGFNTSRKYSTSLNQYNQTA